MRNLLWRLLPLLIITACAGAENSSDPYTRALALLEAGRYAEGRRAAQEALRLHERLSGPEHPNVATTLNLLGVIEDRQGHYAEAEASYRRAVSIQENALGPNDLDTAKFLSNLGAVVNARGQPAEAERLLSRALAIKEAALGPNDTSVADSLDKLAGIYRNLVRDAEAETLERRALAIREQALGPDHLDITFSLFRIGAGYRYRGRYAEAEPLLRRALAIEEEALGPDHPRVGGTLEQLGLTLVEQGRFSDAEPMLRRASAISERAAGSNSPDTGRALLRLSWALVGLDQHAEAEALIRRVLDAEHGDDILSATALNNLAIIHAESGRYAEAEALVQQSLDVYSRSNAKRYSDGRWLAQTLDTQAFVLARGGKLSDAFAAAQSAIEIQRDRIRRDLSSGTDRGETLAQGSRLEAANAVAIGWKYAESKPPELSKIVDSTLAAAQLLRAADTSATVAQVAARFATGEDNLAQLVRERQDLAGRRRALDAALLEAAAREAALRDPADEARARRELAAVDERLRAVSQDLRQRFPEYAELVSPEPVGLVELQRLLAPDEALLAYVILPEDRGRFDVGSDVFLWAVRRDRAEVRRLDLTRDELEAAVRALRAQLDPGLWRGGTPPRFDVGLAHDLYARLLPLEPALLADVHHLLISPDGPLESLPFSALVRSKPKENTSYSEVDWLARTYATTTLPSVSSLRALRRFAKPSRATEPFRGIGDPALTGPTGSPRGIPFAQLLTRGLADPAEVRALPPLPETADELRTLAHNLGAGDDSILLRERATEATVKAGALSGARVVAFATHAGVAGELPGLAEPALVLTPPAAATAEDDGLLTASEAARLKLDADLVLLSACNTAAPDGTPGAPGLSGLAKSFIYAGTRSLLVSHWSVLSDAAQRLTTGMFAELARDPGIGRAEALRRAEMALLNNPRDPLLAHPAAWAPFVVVGEGGGAAAGGS
jgi:CHAT domain-containing protein/Tfp pilus assembly protein PilF